MTKPTLQSYNIHKVLRVGTEVPLPIPDYFLDEVEDRFDLVFMSAKSKPEIQADDGDVSAGLRFYKGEDYLIYRSLSFGNLAIRVTDIQDSTVVEFTRLFARFRGLSNIAQALISLKAVQRDHCFIHAGCVAKGEEAALIVAWADVGKSTTTLSLAENGFHFLADDKVIVNGEGVAYCYPLKVRISRPRWRALLRNVPFLERIQWLYEFRDPTKFGNILERAGVRWVFVLKTSQTQEVTRIDASQAAKFIATSTMSQNLDFRSNRIIQGFSYLDSGLDLLDLTQRQQEIMNGCVRDADCYLISASNPEKFASIISQEIS